MLHRHELPAELCKLFHFHILKLIISLCMLMCYLIFMDFLILMLKVCFFHKKKQVFIFQNIAYILWHEKERN